MNKKTRCKKYGIDRSILVYWSITLISYLVLFRLFWGLSLSLSLRISDMLMTRKARKMRRRWWRQWRHLQFLMSEMNTANPRIPSPFDTAGMLAVVGPRCGAAEKRLRVSTLVASCTVSSVASWLLRFSGYKWHDSQLLADPKRTRSPADFAHREALSFHFMTVKLAS